MALAASVSDSAGTVSQVNFYEGSNFVSAAPVVSSGASVTLSHLAAGTYVFTAVASDSLGAVVTSDPLTNTVAAFARLVQVINFDALNTAGDRWGNQFEQLSGGFWGGVQQCDGGERDGGGQRGIGDGERGGGGVVAAELFYAGGVEPAGEFHAGVWDAAAGVWVDAGGVGGGIGRGVASAVDGDGV